MEPAAVSLRTSPPDPRLVNTVAELAEQLHRLRLATPRPEPTDNPPTLRELAVLTGLPHTTLGNAESGRTLPRVEVVYRFAKACGVPDEQLPEWTQARNRAADLRRREPHPAAPRRPPARSSAASARGGPQGVDEEPFPEQWWQELGGVTLDEAAERLGSSRPESVVAYLQQLHPGFVAQLLATMDPVLAASYLGGLQPQEAVVILNRMDPLAVALLLTLKPVTDAVAYLRLMHPVAAVATLLAMPTASLGQRLAYLDLGLVRQTLKAMSAERRVALLTGPPLAEEMIVELLFSFSFQETVTFLNEAPPKTVIRSLAVLPAGPAADLLNALPRAKAAKLLAAMPATQAAAALTEMPGSHAAALLEPLLLNVSGAILSHMRVPSVARLMAWLPADRRIPILNRIRVDHAVEIRWHMETNSYRTWVLEQGLRLASNPESPPTLAELCTTAAPLPVFLVSAESHGARATPLRPAAT